MPTGDSKGKAINLLKTSDNNNKFAPIIIVKGTINL